MIDNYGNYLIQYKIMFPRLMSFSDSIGSLLPTDISPGPVDGFSKFKQRLEAEKFLQILYIIRHSENKNVM